MEMFEVGGCVRDSIMGIPSKDIDFTVVLPWWEVKDDLGAFGSMDKMLTDMGFDIFLRSPEFLTIRARFPKKEVRIKDDLINTFSFAHHGLTADFVLARKDGPSSDGRRPDFVEVGTLEDDLARRDFTMNAIARDLKGNLIDPHDGKNDIASRLIKCVGNAEDRLREDALRGLRAIRFAVTKGFWIHIDIRNFLETDEFAELLSSVSKERQREEMEKMFAHDTLASLRWLERWPDLTRAVFSDGLRLSATMKG